MTTEIASMGKRDEAFETEQAWYPDELHLRELVGRSNDWFWELDKENSYVHSSPQAIAMLGYAPDELAGKSRYLFMPRQEAERWHAAIELSVREGRGSLRLESCHRHRDGSFRFLESQGILLFDAQGRFAGMRGVDRDITASRRVEQELKGALAGSAQEKGRSEAIIAALGEGINILDPEFRIVYQNQVMKEISGDATGQHCYLIYGNRGTICDDCPVARCYLDGQIHSVEKSMLRRGSLVHLEVTASPLRDETGAIVAGIELVRDVTLRKQAEEHIRNLNADLSARALELELANKDLEAFGYTVSHDLRGPLTNINSYVQAIAELAGPQLDPSCAGFMQSVIKEVRRMDQLITSLLNLSRFAHVRLHQERVDLSGIAKATAAELRLCEPERGVRFEIEEGVHALGDEKLLRMVIMNLFNNAWKFTVRRPDAVIGFRSIESGGKPVYEVSDNGVGFDNSRREELFAVFQRLHRNEEYEGFGIGLTSVRRIIERHCGRIWAEGEAGQGARFFFTLHEEQGAGAG